ncbi:hypothetical protein GCM10027347_44570 [Larkinella harenae]
MENNLKVILIYTAVLLTLAALCFFRGRRLDVHGKWVRANWWYDAALVLVGIWIAALAFFAYITFFY